MTKPREAELWPCGYSATCSARIVVAAPLRSCVISTPKATLSSESPV
jgi:hypothetical protein